jgi:hypothetical protein
MPNKPFPQFAAPMTAASVKEPFDSPDWIFEPKLAGRLVASSFFFAVAVAERFAHHRAALATPLPQFTDFKVELSRCSPAGSELLPSRSKQDFVDVHVFRLSHRKCHHIWRPGKNGGYPNFASDVSCVPGCRGDSVARHSSFKTWSRLGVGDRIRGTHLDQDQVSLSSQPPVFPGLLSGRVWSHEVPRRGTGRPVIGH